MYSKMATSDDATTSDVFPLLIVKLHYSHTCEHATEALLDQLLSDIKQSLSGYACTLQATSTTAPAETILKSAVQYVSGKERVTAYCKTKDSSLTNTFLIEVLTNTKSLPSHVVSSIEEKVKKYLVKDSHTQTVILVRLTPAKQLNMAVSKEQITSSFAVRIQYPQCCVPVQPKAFDTILCGIQQIQDLWTYECTLAASVIEGSQTQTYCRTAPVYSQGQGQKTSFSSMPTVVIDFLYTTQLSPTALTEIEQTVEQLVKDNITKNCKDQIKIKLFHLAIAS